MDPVVAEIGDEERAVLGHRAGHGVLELARSAALGSDRGEEGPVRGELLDPVVVKIGDEDVALFIDRDAGHGREPARKRPPYVHRQRPAPFVAELAVGGEGLDPVVVAVGDVKRAVGAKRGIGGIAELSAPDAVFAGRPPLADEAAVGPQVLNPLIVEIDDVEVAVGRHGHPARRLEFAGSGPGLADGPSVAAIEGEDLDPVGPVIGDVKLIIRHGQVHRPAELHRRLSGGGEGALEVAVEIEDLDAGVAGVTDEHLLPGYGDARGVVELAWTAPWAAPGLDEAVWGLLGERHEGEPAASEENHDNAGNAANPLDSSSIFHEVTLCS